MGDKISQLTSATTLTGTELVPVVQSGTTKKATAADFKTTNAADLVSGTVAAARLPVGSQVNPGILQLGSLSGQACEATDARLSNSRTPSGSAGGDLSGTYPNPSLAASGVVAGTYGTGNVVPQVTVDSKGRVTNVAQATIPIPQAATTNPLPDGVAGPGSSSSYARADHIHQASSTTLTGDVTGTGTGSVPTTLANTGVAQGTYGSSNLVPVVTVDAKGRVLAVSETPFSSSQGGTVTSVDASGGTTGLTVSGGPITDTGTLTLGGTLAIASGGTGATSAAAALTNLGALPAALKGASSGVAELDAGGKVPYAQLPGALGSSPVATLDGNGKVPLAQLYAGTASGLATLDTSGKVPSAQLPSYVDDIIEVPSSSNFPNPGEIGKIYVTLDTNLTYRWTGSTYVQVSSGPLPSSTTPLAAGTADIGVLLTYARADHVHPLQSLATSGVSAGTFGNPTSVPVLTVDEFGRITAASTQAISAVASALQSIEYLIVAGGGSGAGAIPGGGGGAGGVRTGVASIVSGVQLAITIGAGGSAPSGGAIGNNGSASSIVGGAINLSCGGGGGAWGGPGNSGAAGGSGGGGGQAAGGSGNSPVLTWLPSQGNNGGVQSTAPEGYGAGGGGGAGAVGGNGSATNGGNGGVGIQSGITGSSVFYGGGGGGGARTGATAPGTGGNGGGGGGVIGSNSNATNGTANTGGGGGGVGTNVATQGAGIAGTGGSGIVVLRYPSSFPAASSVTGTFTTSVSGGFRIYSFTGNGTITL